jgi:hypothetical protein
MNAAPTFGVDIKCLRYHSKTTPKIYAAGFGERSSRSV